MKKNTYSIISFTLAMVVLLLNTLWPVNLNLIVGFVLMTILAIVSIVFGILGRKESNNIKNDKKWLYRIGIIISTFFGFLDLTTLILFYRINDINFADQFACNNPQYVQKCKKGKKNISKCIFAESINIKCSTDKLKKEQFIK